MARTKVTVDSLANEINKILDQYAGEVNENLSEITKKVGKKGTAALKNESLALFPASKKHKKRYGSTWTSTEEKSRLYTVVTIYNSQPGLPHLLEKGHVSRNGTGRTFVTDKAPVKGVAHISTVEQKLIQEFESEVISKL